MKYIVWVHTGQGMMDPYICRVEADDECQAHFRAVTLMEEKGLWIGIRDSVQLGTQKSVVGFTYADTPEKRDLLLKCVSNREEVEYRSSHCCRCQIELPNPYVLDVCAEAPFCTPDCQHIFWEVFMDAEREMQKIQDKEEQEFDHPF